MDARKYVLKMVTSAHRTALILAKVRRWDIDKCMSVPYGGVVLLYFVLNVSFCQNTTCALHGKFLVEVTVLDLASRQCKVLEKVDLSVIAWSSDRYKCGRDEVRTCGCGERSYFDPSRKVYCCTKYVVAAPTLSTRTRTQTHTQSLCVSLSS